MNRVANALRAYAELTRVSNLPTVISNVLTGLALGAALGEPDAATVAGILCGAVSFYVGGMALNDALDARWDGRERPQRPIPSGRVPLVNAYAIAIFTLVAATGIASLYGAATGAFGFALLAAIVLYNALHKRTILAVILMGACRGLVYCLAAAAVAWPFVGALVGIPAIALSLYTILLTVIARSERFPPPAPPRRATALEQCSSSTIKRTDHNTAPLSARLLALLIPFTVLPIAAFHQPIDTPPAVIAGALLAAWLVYAAWLILRRPARTIPAVLSWLAGISLVDAYILTLLDRPGTALIAGVCFCVTVFSQRGVSGT